MIAPYILNSIGYKHTKKLFLTGELFNANTALNIGLVDEVLENKILNIDNIELIKNLISAAPKAQIKIKSFLKKIHLRKINKSLSNLTAETISKVRVTKEAQEGLAAFLEKRKPNWN